MHVAVPFFTTENPSVTQYRAEHSLHATALARLSRVPFFRTMPFCGFVVPSHPSTVHFMSLPFTTTPPLQEHKEPFLCPTRTMYSIIYRIFRQPIKIRKKNCTGKCTITPKIIPLVKLSITSNPKRYI